MTVYLLRCSINGKGYVGQTTFSLEKRWHQHKYAAARGKSKQALHRALRKYGADAFAISVLCHCTSLEELDFKKREYIIALGTRAPKGYNTTAGGEGSHGPMKGLKHSSESKKKMSEARLGVSVPSRGRPQAKGAKSPFYGKVTFKKHGMLGKQHTEESRNKMSKAGRGRIFTEEHRSNMSKSGQGRVFSDEHRNRLSVSAILDWLMRTVAWG